MCYIPVLTLLYWVLALLSDAVLQECEILIFWLMLDGQLVDGVNIQILWNILNTVAGPGICRRNIWNMTHTSYLALK